MNQRRLFLLDRIEKDLAELRKLEISDSDKTVTVVAKGRRPRYEIVDSNGNSLTEPDSQIFIFNRWVDHMLPNMTLEEALIYFNNRSLFEYGPKVRVVTEKGYKALNDPGRYDEVASRTKDGKKIYASRYWPDPKGATVSNFKSLIR